MPAACSASVATSSGGHELRVAGRGAGVAQARRPAPRAWRARGRGARGCGWPGAAGRRRGSVSASRPSPASTTVRSARESKWRARQQPQLGQTAVAISCASSMTSTGRKSVVVDVGVPLVAQRLEAAPAVVRARAARRRGRRARGRSRRSPLCGCSRTPTMTSRRRGEPLGEQAQGDGLAGAGIAGDEREAALAHQVLDAPAEVFEPGARRRAPRSGPRARRDST